MIPPQLTPDQREVLLALGTWRCDQRPYVRTVARDCGLPVERVRQAIRYFDTRGWVAHGAVFSDEGTAMGSTWWLTEQGTTARDALEGTTA